MKSKENNKSKNKDSSSLILGTGVTLGALTIAEFALIGAVCPSCVVGAPFLVGLGIAKKIQNNKSKNNKDDSKKISENFEI